MLSYTYYPRMPDDCGSYWFRLRTGELLHGYYCSFSYPHDNHVRYADLENQAFYYIHVSEITGYYANN